MRGVIAGAAVVAATVAVFFAISGKDEKPKAKVEKDPGLIKEVKPAAASTNKVELEESPRKEKTAAEKALERRMERDRRNNRRPFVPPAHTSVVYSVSIEEKLFKNRADQLIAILCTTEPGEEIDDPEFLLGRDFNQQLANAAAIKIENDPNDGEYERELKNQVRNLKLELFSRVKNGEDGVQIIKDSFNELHNLGIYKQELAAEVKKAIKDGSLSNEDVEDTLSAANQMLKQRGIPEMKMPGFFRARLKLRQKKYGLK